MALHGPSDYSVSVCNHDASSGKKTYLIGVTYLGSDPVVAFKQ